MKDEKFRVDNRALEVFGDHSIRPVHNKVKRTLFTSKCPISLVEFRCLKKFHPS